MLQQRSRPTWLIRVAAADVVAFACAASAGVHAGLVPEHLREEPLLGVAFVFAAVLLLAAAAGSRRQPLSSLALGSRCGSDNRSAAGIGGRFFRR